MEIGVLENLALEAVVWIERHEEGHSTGEPAVSESVSIKTPEGSRLLNEPRRQEIL